MMNGLLLIPKEEKMEWETLVELRFDGASAVDKCIFTSVRYVLQHQLVSKGVKEGPNNSSDRQSSCEGKMYT